MQRYVVVSAFTETPGHGNAAGVVMEAGQLSEAEMQRLAAHIGVAESAFVTRQDGDSAWVRYFTPTQEIEFCGHASVALGLLLAQQGRWPAHGMTLETQVGRIPLELDLSGETPRIWMRQRDLEMREIARAHRRALADALGVDDRMIHRGLPLVCASTGLWSAFVPLLDSFILECLEPDFAAVSELSRELGVASLHPYAPLGPNRYAARDFAPLVGIPEDPVAGSAAGALIALLAAAGALPRRGDLAWGTCYQGHQIGRPGEVEVRVTFDGERPSLVEVGGCAVVEREGRLG